MSELTTARKEEQRMTSIEVAELTGKRHDNVTRDIKSLIDQGAINALNFEEIAYTDSRNRAQSMYSLDFKASMVLVTGYDAVKRAAVIDRWVALETGKAVPVMAGQIKTANGLLEVDKAFRAALRMAKAIGLDTNAAIISANQLARKVTGSDALQLLEVRGIKRPVEDHPLTPTEIGKFIGNLSGQAINKLLLQDELQTKNGDIYTPTTKGAEFAVLLDTGKRHGDGTPIHQLKWKRRVVDQLKRSILDQVEPEAVTEN